MANDLNRCEFIGRVGQEIETKFTPSGDAVVNFSIAVNESYKNKAGTKQESVTWIRLVAWRKLAEIIGQYVKKGDQLFVSGKMVNKFYEKEGTTVYQTEITVQDMQMLSSNNQSNQSAQQAPPPAKSSSATPAVTEPQDIPF